MPQHWWVMLIFSALFYIGANITAYVAHKLFPHEWGVVYLLQSVVFHIATVIFFLRSFFVD